MNRLRTKWRTRKNRPYLPRYTEIHKSSLFRAPQFLHGVFFQRARFSKINERIGFPLAPSNETK